MKMKKVLILVGLLAVTFSIPTYARYSFTGLDVKTNLETNLVKQPNIEGLLDRGLIEGALDGTYQLYKCSNNHSVQSTAMYSKLLAYISTKTIDYLEQYYTILLSDFIKDTYCGSELQN